MKKRETPKFKRITSESMASKGFHRYEVRSSGQFIGEVFQIRFGKAVRWVAQSADGSICGIVAHLWTRKAACVSLVNWARKTAGGAVRGER